MSAFTKNPYTINPYIISPYTINPYNGTFEFTNDAEWSSTPYIEVTGTPEILWTWSDGTMDNKAMPDAVTVVGTHTLEVTPWSAVTLIDFDGRNLVGLFNTMEWWKMRRLSIHGNAGLTGTLRTYAWIDLKYLFCSDSAYTGNFKTSAWPALTQLYCKSNDFSGTFILQEWSEINQLMAYNNGFTSLTGSFQTQIKMVLCYFQNNAITSHEQIDLALSDLVVNAEDLGRTDTCTVNFSEGTNSGPTSAGTLNKNILVNTWGWTVTLNAEV